MLIVNTPVFPVTTGIIIFSVQVGNFDSGLTKFTPSLIHEKNMANEVCDWFINLIICRSKKR